MNIANINNIDLSYCPTCSSENISAVFHIITDKSKSKSKSKCYPTSICKNCGYSDEWMGFEKTNRSNLRDEKINKILNGI